VKKHVVKFLFELVHLIINMGDEQMLEDIKYMNAKRVYFRIFVVHIPKDGLQIFQIQESINRIYRINNIEEIKVSVFDVYSGNTYPINEHFSKVSTHS
jgi:hypothetical protein